MKYHLKSNENEPAEKKQCPLFTLYVWLISGVHTSQKGKHAGVKSKAEKNT